MRKDADTGTLEKLFKEIQSLYPDIEYSGTLQEMTDYYFFANNPERLREKKICKIIFTKDELDLRLVSEDVGIGGWSPTFAKGRRQVYLKLDVHKHYGITSYFYEYPHDALRLMELVCCIFKRLDSYFACVNDENSFALRPTTTPMPYATLEYLIAVLGQSYPDWTTFLFDRALAEDIGLDTLRKWGKISRNIEDDGYFISRTEIPFIFNWTEKNITEGIDRIYLEQILPKIKNRLYLEYSNEL